MWEQSMVRTRNRFRRREEGVSLNGRVGRAVPKKCLIWSVNTRQGYLRPSHLRGQDLSQDSPFQRMPPGDWLYTGPSPCLALFVSHPRIGYWKPFMSLSLSR